MASKEEIAAFIASEFPQTACMVEAVGNGSATVWHPVGHDELRPGGTVSGPVLMSIADVALAPGVMVRRLPGAGKARPAPVSRRLPACRPRLRRWPA